MTLLTNRFEFVYLFDVTNGNPNGDPDAGNMPRVDPETDHGVVTDVCLKRKIRNYVSLVHDNRPGHAIYVQEKAVLNLFHKEAYQALGLEPEAKKLPSDPKKAEDLTKWMCTNFFDIRSFGAVMTTGVNCGQVRGPIQLGFASSIEPVLPRPVTITRMAVTNEKDAEKDRTMGIKHILPYGLYRAHGFVSAKLAQRTGFTESDLALVWRSLVNLFEHDRSAARGEMAARKLIVFKHESEMGNAPAHTLFDAVKVKRVEKGSEFPARHFSDYVVTIEKEAIAKGVEVIEHI